MPARIIAPEVIRAFERDLPDDELREWLIAYGPARAYVGKPRLVDDKGAPLSIDLVLASLADGHARALRLEPAFIYGCTIGRTQQGIVRERLITAIELFEGDDGVVLSTGATTFVPLRGCTTRDLADIRRDIVHALATKGAMVEARNRAESPIALAAPGDIAKVTNGGRS